MLLLLQYKLFLNAISLKCDKTIDTCPFVFDSVPDRYKTPEMCDNSVVAFLPTLKFVPDWFVTSKTIKSLDDDLFSNDDIILVNEDSNNITIFSDEMGIFSVDLNNTNLDDVNLDDDDDDDPETIIHVRLMSSDYVLKQSKAF